MANKKVYYGILGGVLGLAVGIVVGGYLGLIIGGTFLGGLKSINIPVSKDISWLRISERSLAGWFWLCWEFD